MNFSEQIEEMGFKKVDEKNWKNLDGVVIKVYNENNIKVVTKDSSKIFCFLDTEQRVVDFIKELK